MKKGQKHKEEAKKKTLIHYQRYVYSGRPMHSEETRRNISKGLRKYWNSKLSKKEKEQRVTKFNKIVAKNGRRSFTKGHIPWSKGKKMSQEFKDKCRQGMIEYHQNNPRGKRTEK